MSSTTSPATLVLSLRDGLLHLPRHERLTLAEPDVAQQLRRRLEDAAYFAGAFAGLDDRGQYLQRRDQPVTGRLVVAEDNVGRLLAADVAPRMYATPLLEISLPTGGGNRHHGTLGVAGRPGSGTWPTEV